MLLVGRGRMRVGRGLGRLLRVGQGRVLLQGLLQDGRGRADRQRRGLLRVLRRVLRPQLLQPAQHAWVGCVGQPRRLMSKDSGRKRK